MCCLFPTVIYLLENWRKLTFPKTQFLLPSSQLVSIVWSLLERQNPFAMLSVDTWNRLFSTHKQIRSHPDLENLVAESQFSDMCCIFFHFRHDWWIHLVLLLRYHRMHVLLPFANGNRCSGITQASCNVHAVSLSLPLPGVLYHSFLPFSAAIKTSKENYWLTSSGCFLTLLWGAIVSLFTRQYRQMYLDVYSLPSYEHIWGEGHSMSYDAEVFSKTNTFIRCARENGGALKWNLNTGAFLSKL